MELLLYTILWKPVHRIIGYCRSIGWARVRYRGCDARPVPCGPQRRGQASKAASISSTVPILAAIGSFGLI